MSDRVTKRLVVRGRVQGVGYRYATMREARLRGVTGWVRNRRDGTVEAVLQGSRDAVDAMIAWAEGGPEAALVEGIEVTDTEGEFAGFESRPTE